MVPSDLRTFWPNVPNLPSPAECPLSFCLPFSPYTCPPPSSPPRLPFVIDPSFTMCSSQWLSPTYPQLFFLPQEGDKIIYCWLLVPSDLRTFWPNVPNLPAPAESPLSFCLPFSQYTCPQCPPPSSPPRLPFVIDLLYHVFFSVALTHLSSVGFSSSHSQSLSSDCKLGRAELDHKLRPAWGVAWFAKGQSSKSRGWAAVGNRQSRLWVQMPLISCLTVQTFSGQVITF